MTSVLSHFPRFKPAGRFFNMMVAMACCLVQITAASCETTGTIGNLEYLEGDRSVTVIWSSPDTKGDVTIPGRINGKPVTEIGPYAFAERGEIERISIPGSVRKIGALAFSGCSGLKRIKIPEGVEMLESWAFSGCLGLREIELPASIRRYQAAFSGCKNVTEIRVHGSNPNFVSRDGVVFSRSGNELLEYPSGRAGAYEIPHGVRKIAGGAFSGSAITAVGMPETVVKTGTMVFMECAGLKSVRISPRMKVIEALAFHNCTGLESIRIPSGVTYIGHSSFAGCKSLKRVSLPETVTGISNYAFWFCTSLRNIGLPDSLVDLESGAFDNSGLVSVTIPSRIKKLDSVFSGCASLREVNLPPRLVSIGQRAFYECASLERIVIPERVRSIGEEAFAHCRKLEKVTFKGDAPKLEASAFGRGRNLTIYRYDDASGFSKNAWRRFVQVKLRR